ncbi:transposase [Paraburkholderia sp. BL10I2N1]|uniref:transposase n=1 Tax=Paraburkholderia sp. BL10I2N1 TaxID=1938796 RepID=UPI0010EBD63A|nr:transposase [Paraburkholderia sp. BL10I2N1]TDN67423.1 DDE family transposase [Paraburkholderia sp. BL10I2N1]
MTQLGLGLDLSTKRTRKREFLDEMRRVVPWLKLIALIEPHYPTGKTGRPPFPIATMLQIHFSMKLHIGVDSQSGLAHSAVVTAANVHDKHPLPQLLHGQEQRVDGDSAYAGQKALIHGKAPKARDFTNKRTRRKGRVDEVARRKKRNKSKIRARVEHVFAVVKRLRGFTKARYRGLAKNANREVRQYFECERQRSNHIIGICR